MIVYNERHVVNKPEEHYIEREKHAFLFKASRLTHIEASSGEGKLI